MVPLELVDIFIRLQLPETRQSGARELAAYTNATEVLLFGKDEEVGVFLPALGFPQTLRQGARWQVFLRRCAQTEFVQETLPSPSTGSDAMALGIHDRLGLSVVVFLDAVPDSEQRRGISALLPLLGAKLAIERTAQSAEGHATAAREASRHASALNTALDANRRELQQTYERAEKELVFRREAERKLREADRRKDEFLAMLAHELRNPLAPISMAAHILKLPLGGGDRVGQASQIIDRQVKHMTSLLDDLLDVSRVTRGLITLSKQAAEFKSIVADAIEQTRPLIESQKHRLTVQLAHEPVQVHGDRTRLVQVITNLLNNAAKYTTKGGNISLHLDVEAQEIKLSVRDTGIGIDAALLPRVFDLFTQAERSPDRSQGGLGLGLALVKSLVGLHGGTVSAHSEGPGKGSEFVVRLPRLTSAPEQVRDPAHVTSQQMHEKALRVLIVDDNVDAAQTLGLFLETMGHDVLIAYHGKDAIEVARHSSFDVFMLDIGLPDMDGHELARMLRASPQTARAVFVALTGYGQPNDQVRSRAAGFDHHLTKPANATKLAHLLCEVSEHANKRSPNAR
jgi:signal transduction histidine kinase/ActR/RegA family two-component response regulator